MSIQRPKPTASNPPQRPSSPLAPRPKKKLQLDVNDVDAVLERKISP